MPPQRTYWFQWAYASVFGALGLAGLIAINLYPPKGQPFWAHMALSFAVGASFGVLLRDLFRLTMIEREWRRMRHMPEKIAIDQSDDGTFTAFVTRFDGEPSVVRLPEDYDPREDGGMRMLEIVTGLPADHFGVVDAVSEEE